MSRVFLAEEANAERFEREIQLAACLQHLHIFPLPTADVSEVESFALAPGYKRERLGRLAQEPGT